MGAKQRRSEQLSVAGAGKRAALYVRVSSEEQVEGYSLPAQERAIGAYCAFHGFEITAHYRDEGKSARSDDLDKRPAFKRMLDAAYDAQLEGRATTRDEAMAVAMAWSPQRP